MPNTNSLDVSVKVNTDDTYSYRVDIQNSKPDNHTCTLTYIEDGAEEWMAFSSPEEMEVVALAMLRAVAASKA